MGLCYPPGRFIFSCLPCRPFKVNALILGFSCAKNESTVGSVLFSVSKIFGNLLYGMGVDRPIG